MEFVLYENLTMFSRTNYKSENQQSLCHDTCTNLRPHLTSSTEFARRSGKISFRLVASTCNWYQAEVRGRTFQGNAFRSNLYASVCPVESRNLSSILSHTRTKQATDLEQKILDVKMVFQTVKTGQLQSFRHHGNVRRAQMCFGRSCDSRHGAFLLPSQIELRHDQRHGQAAPMFRIPLIGETLPFPSVANLISSWGDAR